MSEPGMGAMLHYLSGGSEKDPKEYFGKKIKNAWIGEFNKRGAEQALFICFDDGLTIAISDQAQSCCEHRYLTCDDDTFSLNGQILKSIETKDYKETQGEYGDEHEIVFLEIQGDKSSITLCTHNEHNGYYGGFGLSINEVSSVN